MYLLILRSENTKIALAYRIDNKCTITNYADEYDFINENTIFSNVDYRILHKPSSGIYRFYMSDCLGEKIFAKFFYFNFKQQVYPEQNTSKLIRITNRNAMEVLNLE
jgi:hypothetical protein